MSEQDDRIKGEDLFNQGDYVLQRRLDRMDVKLDRLQDGLLLMARLEERLSSDRGKHARAMEEHKEIFERLTAVERFQWRLAGMVLVVALVAGFFAPDAWSLLKGAQNS